MKMLDGKWEHVPKGKLISYTCALNRSKVKRRMNLPDSLRVRQAAKGINVADRR